MNHEIDFVTFDNLMEKDANVVYELSCLVSNIKKEDIRVLDSFLSFLKKYENKKSHNIRFLMLDLRFKILHFVFSLIGREQGKAIVEEYDRKFLFLMLLKCHYHLHPLAKSERGVVDQRVKEDNNLDILTNDIFEIANTSELAMQLINRKLLSFKI
jgi:hypothetical protein